MHLDKKYQLPYGSIKEIINDSQKNKIASLALIIFFCSAIMDSFFVRILPDYDGVWYFINSIENIILGIPIILCYKLISKDKKLNVWPFFMMIAFLFLLTYIIHPEYEEWFIHVDYGIYNQFLVLKRGVFILLIISLFTDARKLLNAILVAVKICFLFYLMQYFMASIRGYWEGIDYTGEIVEASYSLGFGYDMSFCAVAFGCLAIWGKWKRYWILFAISIFTILTGGSRGALLCLAGGILVPIIVEWRSILKSSRRNIILFFVSITAITVFFMMWDHIVILILNTLERLNIQSRTIEMLLNGNIMSDNGRNQISDMAIELIKEGGLWGHGIYGDRHVIGQEFYWGYSHNIILEMYVSFGYVGATMIICVMAYFIFKFIYLCKEKEWKILFVIFFSCSLQLLMSDSFWYNTYFWGTVGVLGLWYRNKKVKNRALLRETYERGDKISKKHINY